MLRVTAEEIFRIALVIVLAPAYVSVARTIRPTPGREPLFGAGVFVLLAWVFDVVDTDAVVSVTDVLQHLCYAAAGVLGLAGILAARRAVLSERGRL